jgi:hypothetical protein
MSVAQRLESTGEWKMDAKTRIVIFSLMKFGLRGNRAAEASLCAVQSTENVVSPAKCGDTCSYAQRIAEAEWIFSRAEGLLLAATATTSEMPGGMERLTHTDEYTQAC